MFYQLYVGILLVGLFCLGCFAVHLDSTKPPTSKPKVITVHKIKQYEILCAAYKNNQCIRYDVFKVTEE